MERVSVPKFILALLFFITMELACCGNTHNGGYIQSELKALVDFKSGINDPNNRLSSWRGVNYCSWLGITCENGTGFVISIDLHNPYPRQNIFENGNPMNLSGEIRPSLGELKHLTYLDLSFNSFQAMPIPEFFGSLHNLIHLGLSDAGFQGKVPSNLGNLSNLQYLDLSSTLNYFSMGLHSGYSNQLSVEDIEWLTSLVSLKYLSLDLVDLASVGNQLAKALNRLPNITQLHLAGCYLKGSFLVGLGDELPNLEYLDLYSNRNLQGNVSQVLSKSWRKLEFLYLGDNRLYGSIPSSIGNFCNLKYLDLSSNDLNGSLPASVEGHEACGDKIALVNLMELDMSFNQLRGPLPNWLGEVKNLRVLNLHYNNLEGVIPHSLWTLQHLEYLNFHINELNGSIPSSIGNFCNLTYLDLRTNHLDGSLPERIEGYETCGGKRVLPNLMALLLTGNELRGKLPDWLGEVSNLRKLDLSFNLLEGPIPDSLWKLQHLELLILQQNELNRNLPKSIGQLSQLQTLDVSHNLLSGTLSEQHFWNLSKLYFLNMASNSFHLNVSPNWIPPFQLSNLYMGSCRLGPSFPTWLQSQNNLQDLDFSNASISSPIPNWFWSFSSFFERVDLSHNQIHGQLPNSLNFSRNDPFGLSSLDLSSNQLTGTIPDSVGHLSSLDLSNNNFTGVLPDSIGHLTSLRYIDLSNNSFTGVIPDSIKHLTSLRSIDLSNNNFTGVIPDSIGHLTSLLSISFSRNNLTGSISDSIGQLTFLQFILFSRNNLTGTLPNSIAHLTSLEVIDFSINSFIGSIPTILNNCSSLLVIDLGHNNFSGEIPNSLGRLELLQSLHLNHNKLSGALPPSFQNLSRLQVLDVSYNKLSCEVPAWIGFAFPNLVILNLRSNLFYGRLPSQVSNLSSLHFLNIAQNNLRGEIPHTLGELKAMAQENITICELLANVSTSSYEERLVVQTKGQILEYTRTLSLVVAIDLSDNNLSGSFPQGITKLTGLVVLNLSRNHIIGQIPENISMLHQLSSLDLSSNEISGTIPSSMAALTFLSYLNLSENKLSGEIPFTGQMTTFNEISFVGNSDLCGPPLARKCRDEDLSKRQPNVVGNKNDGGYIDQWFYLSIGLGFAMGILVPYIVLIIRKSWCETYFDFVDGIVKWLLRGRMNYTKHHWSRRG